MAAVETAMDLGITANLMGISATVCSEMQQIWQPSFTPAATGPRGTTPVVQ
jgi:hypothetical protein